MITKKLSEILEFQNGSKAVCRLGTIPVFGGNGVLGHSDTSNYSNVIIVGRVGAYCGSIHLANGKCWVSDNAIAGIHKDPKCSKFNYYLMKSLNLGKQKIGSSQPLLTQQILNNILVTIPDEATDQIRIAEILSALDDKIELNNKVNQELEKMAKDLYNYWFVQFDFPDGNKRPLLSRIFNLLKPFKISEVCYA